MDIKRIFFKLIVFSVFITIILGCTAVRFTGDMIRSIQKDIDIAVSPNIKPEVLKFKRNIAINVNSSARKVKMGVGVGTTNNMVVSDMITMEFMKLGYVAKAISGNISETSPQSEFKRLADNGFNVVLIGNMDLSATSSTAGYATGGEATKTGIISFTIKGIDIQTGEILFIASATYGKAKDSKTVAEDIAEVYDKVIKGKIK